MVEKTSESLSDVQAEERIRKLLQRREGTATAGDVAAETGLPYDRAESVLKRMLSIYKSHLDVDDDGNLLYRFDPKMVRRGELPGQRWARIKAALWKAFVVFFKVCIMVTLVGYTVVFLLLLLALAVGGFAASRSSDNEEVGQIGILPLYLLARILEFLFWWDILSNFGGRPGPFDRMGRGVRARQSKKPRKKPEKPFYQRIFDYVFGPETKPDRLATERAFAQFVRSRKGRIAAAEWASRSGQSLEEADRALTAGVVRFRGDVDVTEDGAMVYRFDELRVTAKDDQSASEPPPIWEREPKVPPLTGNTRKANGWITALNGFNLVMSGLIVAGAHSNPEAGTPFFLGYFPFGFSLVFFAVPALRALSRRRALKRAAREQQRREAIGTVYRASTRSEAEPIVETDLPEGFRDRVLKDYQGDIDVDDDGAIHYRFPVVAAQYEAARRMRERAAEDSVEFGRTVFSSDDDEKSLHEHELEEFDEKLERELGGAALAAG